MPITPSAVPANAKVRARLTEGEISRLRIRELFPIRDQTVEGRVLRADDRGLGLFVPIAVEFGSPNRSIALGQQIQIEMDGIVEARVQRLDKVRTGVVTGLGIVLLTSFILDNFTGWFGSNREVPGPDKDGVM